MNIGYKLVQNATPTADKSPYFGMAVPVGSLAYDNILKDMVAAGTKMSLQTAKFFLDAFYEFAAERIAEEVVRINTGTVAIYPMIDGSFDSEDAEFDPERNSLYIGATLSQSLRDRADGNVRRSEECPVVFEEGCDYPYVENPFTDGVDWHGGTVRGENNQVVCSVPWQV